MEGRLSVIMVMENCQCSYTGLFDQVLGEIRTGSRAVGSLTVPGGQEFHFPHFSQILIIFSYFSSNVSHFLPHFGSPGGRLAHPGRPWLRHWPAGLFQNLSLHHIFIDRKVVWHKNAPFFFSSATRTDMKSKGSFLALVCVSIKFIDFNFLVSLLTHFKRKTKKTRDHLCLQADTGIQAHIIFKFAFWWQVRTCGNTGSDLMTLYPLE